MNINLKAISARIQQFFDPNEVERIAWRTKFVQRSPKLTGIKFLEAMVFTGLEKGKITLSSLTQSCLDLDVKISEQGIDARLDETSVEFLRTMSVKALEQLRNEEPLAVKLLEQFSHVFLLDSSQISLPENLSELFAGTGGCASKASMKIQLVFDYLHGCISLLELCNGRDADQGYRGHWSLIKAGAFYMMDLGYFVLDTFKKIHDSGGYFLSRFQLQTGIARRDGTSIDLEKFLDEQTEPMVEVEILLGSRAEHRIPCRMVAYSLPQEVAERRRQKAKENGRRQGRTVSQKHLKLMNWSVYVTNVPSDMLNAKHIASLYRIRWQIELVFKMCKSFFALDEVTSLRSQRILSEFYARLIGVVVTYFLIAPIRLPFGPNHNREISSVKVRQIFQRFARSILSSLHNIDTLVDQVSDFFRHVLHCGFKQKRQKSPNSIHMLDLISACYSWEDQDIDDFFEQLSPTQAG